MHEHIEPVNVLAVGETVKLRSDCVRECIADIEFNTPEGCAELRRRDVHDFGMLLLECLTLEKRYNPGLNLPDVFRRMIPHMLDGTWTLEQVGQLLNPPAAAPRPSAAHGCGNLNSGSSNEAAIGSRQGESRRSRGSRSRRLCRSMCRAALKRLLRNLRFAIAARSPTSPGGFNLRPWILGGLAAVIVCIIVIWHFVSAKPAQPVQTQAPVQQAPAVSTATPQPEPQPAAQPVVRACQSG